MAQEIERKFLVINQTFTTLATVQHKIRQGYISRHTNGTVRIRIIDNEARITVKSKNIGAVRNEWEYAIPVADAIEMLATCCVGNMIEKTRYVVPSGGFTWEVDVFHGNHEGLIVAEIELPDEHTSFTTPPFIGDEVTGNAAYYNSNL
jgi:CYTH domain-containing protein